MCHPVIALWESRGFGYPRGTTNLPQTSAELQKVAARARDHALRLVGDTAGRRLLEADELEARAAAMEAPLPITPAKLPAPSDD